MPRLLVAVVGATLMVAVGSGIAATEPADTNTDQSIGTLDFTDGASKYIGMAGHCAGNGSGS